MLTAHPRNRILLICFAWHEVMPKNPQHPTALITLYFSGFLRGIVFRTSNFENPPAK